MHTHGGYGYDFGDADFAKYSSFAKAITREGVTRYCPATVTLPIKEVTNILTIFSQWMKNQNIGLQARCIGAHIEGPFISPIQKGAHRQIY